MFKASTFAKGTIAAVAGVAALGAAVSAAAQPYGSYGNGGAYYDPCRRESTNRSTVGALLGGVIGAAIGSNAAARNARTEGALLGGALGAAVGGTVGHRSAACNSGYQTPYTTSRGYYGDGRYGDDNGYQRDYYGDGRGYQYGRYDRDAWAYGRGGERYRIAERDAGPDGCTLAESPIHMPDGRTQMRFVRVCMDPSGRYQVVD